MHILFLFFSLFALADRSEVKNLIDKSFTHDNTFCNLNGKRVEFQLRGMNKFTDPKEKNHGEHVFYRNKVRLNLLPLNKEGLHSYKFFSGHNSICSKSLGFNLDNKTSAILFQKENRPYVGKLAIQLFDSIKQVPLDAVETEYATDEVVPFKDGFAFKIIPDRHDMEMGSIKINDVQYTYQDRDFQLWMSYSLKGFEPQGLLTYEKFPWKHFFQDENDFFQTTGWDPKSRQFTITYLHIAVNHKLKKECLLVTPVKVQVNGSEVNWRCR